MVVSRFVHCPFYHYKLLFEFKKKKKLQVLVQSTGFFLFIVVYLSTSQSSLEMTLIVLWTSVPMQNIALYQNGLYSDVLDFFFSSGNITELPRGYN